MNAAPVRNVSLGAAEVLVERRADGAILLRSPHKLAAYPRSLTECLAHWARESSGRSTRVARVMLLDAPPSIDAGEVTDKGSINQRAVLRNRAALVERLYEEPPAPDVIVAASN